MFRVSQVALVAACLSGLSGCPIYGGNYDDTLYPSGYDASLTPCYSPADCGPEATCGLDGVCHENGDCTQWGCSSGYECVQEASSYYPTCQPVDPHGTGGAGGESTSPSGGSGGLGGASGSDGGAGGAPTYCGNPAECPSGLTCAPDGTCQAGLCTTTGCVFGYNCGDDGICTSAAAGACGEDSECASAGSGFLCVNGACTAPENQCFDQTQCPQTGAKCVEGKCIAGCETSTDCKPSYSCNVALGICSIPVKACGDTADCGTGDEVCVDGACVPRSDEGNCPSGEVWVANGCVPNQAATFICSGDGVEDSCAVGSVCLHHSCYISCASPQENACEALASFGQCKEVVTTIGAFPVCGSESNLGGECDLTSELLCADGKICVDGFCK